MSDAPSSDVREGSDQTAAAIQSFIRLVSCAQQTPAIVRQSVEEWLARSSLR